MLSEKQTKSVKKVLIDKDKTVSDMAREVGVARTYASSVLNGKMNNKDLEAMILQYRNDLKKGERKWNLFLEICKYNGKYVQIEIDYSEVE